MPHVASTIADVVNKLLGWERAADIMQFLIQMYVLNTADK